MFPPSIEGKIRVFQTSGKLVEQSVPPLVPAYNKYMGGIDLSDHLHKYYGSDRHCERPWTIIFVRLCS